MTCLDCRDKVGVKYNEDYDLTTNILRVSHQSPKGICDWIQCYVKEGFYLCAFSHLWEYTTTIKHHQQCQKPTSALLETTGKVQLSN